MAVTSASRERPIDGDQFVAAARELVPTIRELARSMEQARRLDDDLVQRMDDVGLFSLLVPRRWGGPGLGPRELNEVVERIAHGDVSTAWVTSFYNLHNWLLCRYPLEVQEELFDNRSSILAAAVLSRPGDAVAVADGFRVSGRWGYATGIHHSSHALVPAMCEGTMSWCLVERTDLEVIDDWDMAAMAATGSDTIAAHDVFVPRRRVISVERLMNPRPEQDGPDAEMSSRLPFAVMALTTASLYLGALDAAVDLARDRLGRASGLTSTPRIERQAMRINWVQAHQTARVLRLVRDAATEDAIRLALTGESVRPEQEAQTQLDIMTLLHGAKDALRTLVDASGTSGYRNSDPLRRIANDMAMISTHALNGEYDVAMDRHARRILGVDQQRTKGR